MDDEKILTLDSGKQVRLGRIRPVARASAPRLDAYFNAADANPPASVDYYTKAKDVLSRMYLNDTYGDCLVAGTRITMADGTTKAVENIRVGDQVMTAEGNVGPVTATMRRPENNRLIRVVSSGNGILKTTENHPFLTRRGYVKAKDLNSSDWITLPVRGIGNKTHINTADHLDSSKLYGMNVSEDTAGYLGSLNNQKARINEALEKFPKQIELDYDFGRLVGLFLAEGSTNQNISTWTFGAHEKETYFAEVINILGQKFGINPNTSFVEGRNSIEIRICSKVWRVFFESLCGKSAHNKRCHSDIMNGPKEFLEGVFSGWTDGDGWVSKNKLSGISVSHSLAIDMYNIAQSLGKFPTITTRNPGKSKAPNGPNGELVEVNASRSWTVTVANEIKNRHGVSWNKTAKKWNAWGQTLEGKTKNLGCYELEEDARDVAVAHRASKQFNSTAIKPVLENGTVWRRIRNIQSEKYSGDVYTFEVDGDNSYVAEGIGISNCVVASAFHELGLWSANSTGVGIQATDAEVKNSYFTVCGRFDQGCIITEYMDSYRDKGIVAGGKNYKIDGYASVDWTNKLEVQVAIYLFGCLKLGINLPNGWTSADIWDVNNAGRIVGGHDVSAVGYDADYVYISTWGEIRKITWAAFTSTKWLEEAYCLLSPDWYGTNKLAPNGVDLATLQSDLAKLGGGTIPPLSPPTPIVPPVPVVPPSPPTPIVPPSPPVPPSNGMTLDQALSLVKSTIENNKPFGPFGAANKIESLLIAAFKKNWPASQR